MNRFLGIGTNGEASAQPIRQTDTGFALFFKDARNLHVPSGVLTNEDIGYTELGSAIAASATRFMGWLERSGGTRHLVEVLANGNFYDQGDLTGTWVSKATGLSTDRYHGMQYADNMHLCNGTDHKVYSGTALNDWIITGPASMGTPVDSGSGSFEATAGGYRYLYFYKRASDGFMSPASPRSVTTGNFSAKAQVDVPITAKTTQGVDKVVIYRTIDGGGVFRFLVEQDSSLTTYADSTDDANLSLDEAPTETSIDDLSFTMMAVLNDRIYVAGITEESVIRPTRIRWTYPGQPWRFEALDFSDEAPAEVVAMLATIRGLVAWTGDEALEVRDLGGGAHAIDPAPFPGAHNQWSVVNYGHGFAWFTPQAVYTADLEDGFRNIADPPGPLSSIETLLADVNSWTIAWIANIGALEYLVVGVALIGGTIPDTMLVYDLTRKGWWRVEYGGEFPVEVPGSTAEKTKTRLYLGQDNGETFRAFNGQSKDGAALVPQWSVNPMDLGITEEKRFRFLDLHYDLVSDVTWQFDWTVDKGRASKGTQIAVTRSGDLLGSTFLLGSSMLAAEDRQVRRFNVGKRGTYIDFVVKDPTGDSMVVVPALDICFQETTRRVFK